MPFLYGDGDTEIPRYVNTLKWESPIAAFGCRSSERGRYFPVMAMKQVPNANKKQGAMRPIWEVWNQHESR